ncbi:MAG: glycoside hydrolase family 31 protein [Holophaga sp.]|nr:glycoside hydrolase family 31 protein [Holophaga sp.]
MRLAADSGVPSEQIGQVRVQALSPTLVRLEVKGPHGFEDRPSFHVVRRDWPGVRLRRAESGGDVVLRAGSWSVWLPAQARDLRELRIKDAKGDVLYVWDVPTSTRALPAPGERPRAWAMADAPRVIPPPWGAIPAPPGAPRAETSGWDLGNDATDLYVFLPGGDYHRLRADLLRLTGPTELPPLFLFGGFHSRYYPYTDRGVLALIREYRERRLPLDVFMVDTDWRVSASFGYDENLKLFPDMAEFLDKAHGLGVKVGFNDHPKPVADLALDPAEMKFRFDNLGRWLQLGVDFWWFDRNWEVSLAEPLPGLRKESWGMQVFHDTTLAVRPDRRPLIMANVDGVDNGHLNRPSDLAAHRFAFQWTGDTLVGWGAVREGVENAVRLGVASLVPYVSEDLGGHEGIPSPELYLRSFQFGTLSAVVRPHCSNSPFFVREPWTLGPQVEAIARDYLRMRYRLLPHLYGAARRNYDTGEPLLRRLDLDDPRHPEAAANDQYLLGDGLLVAPITDGEPCLQPVPGAWLRTGDGRPGVRLELFGNENLLGGSLASRVEPRVDAQWSDLPPGPGIPPEHFSARWSGTVTPDRPVQLGLRVEEGGRLWLDGRLMVDQWIPGARDLGLDPVTLEPGRSHLLVVELRHGEGDAYCHLLFRPMELPSAPARRPVWLPEGEWINAWTGERVRGPRRLEVPAAASVTPMFLRAGSLFPLAPDMQHTGEKPWDPLTLDVYPHPAQVANGELYEDDGQSNGYRRGACRRTALEARMGPGRKVTVKIGRAAGAYLGALQARAWVLRLHLAPGLRKVRQVRLDGRRTGWRLLPRGPAATPFQLRGPALDGDVLEVELPPEPVARGRVVEIS